MFYTFMVAVVSGILCMLCFVVWAVCEIFDQHISTIFLKATCGFAITALFSILSSIVECFILCFK